MLNEKAILDYEVTNTSTQYDADVKIICNIIDEEDNIVENNSYITIKYEPNSMRVLAGKTENGRITAKLFKVATEDQSIKVKCTLNASAIERDTAGSEYVKPETNYLRVAEPFDTSVIEVDDWTDTELLPYAEYKGSVYLGHEIDRTKIETLTFLDTNEVPLNALESWDVSEKGNGSIMAYILDEDNDGMWEMFIGQNGGVIANPNSTCLFLFLDHLTEINGIEKLDTADVTDMEDMFCYCRSLQHLNLSALNTSNVSSLMTMFNYCLKLETLDVSFDTSKVTTMAGMFNWCNSLTSLDLSGFNTKNVIDMQSMFFGCYELKELNISSFDTSNVTDMSDMFSECRKLSILDLSSFVINKVTNVDYMFYNMPENAILKVKDVNTQNWVLTNSNRHPSTWFTDNVVII